MSYQSREEQEVILRYDRQLDEWYYYGDVPALNKKWRQHVIPEKEVVKANGTIALLEGKVIGNVTIAKKRVLSEEQKLKQVERLKQARINSKAVTHSSDCEL